MLYLVRHDRNNLPDTYHVKVIKIGTKYFTVEVQAAFPWQEEFYIQTWRERTTYTSNLSLYESQQAYAEARELERILSKLRERFRNCSINISLEQAQAIEAILNEKKKK